ncbi:nucleotidyltransferase domain-containing protein [Marinomonas sp. FW-1]|uniref:nucleotidyltransferase domain-containing protein n=1 Tax=Marinomonas sp. FW-1 TaxID=2071621 RepID=UPI0010C023DD|nr:nucleotidyltransferase domain-containing protein [Marinomonas sp. FW-1]
MTLSQYGIPNQLLEKMSETFSKYPDIEKVTLFGSRATGNFRNGSDIDLSISTRKSDIIPTLRIELDDLNSPYLIDLVDENNLTNQALLAQIRESGVVIYTV